MFEGAMTVDQNQPQRVTRSRAGGWIALALLVWAGCALPKVALKEDQNGERVSPNSMGTRASRDASVADPTDASAVRNVESAGSTGVEPPMPAANGGGAGSNSAAGAHAESAGANGAGMHADA